MSLSSYFNFIYSTDFPLKDLHILKKSLCSASNLSLTRDNSLNFSLAMGKFPGNVISKLSKILLDTCKNSSESTVSCVFNVTLLSQCSFLMI